MSIVIYASGRVEYVAQSAVTVGVQASIEHAGRGGRVVQGADA